MIIQNKKSRKRGIIIAFAVLFVLIATLLMGGTFGSRQNANASLTIPSGLHLHGIPLEHDDVIFAFFLELEIPRTSFTVYDDRTRANDISWYSGAMSSRGTMRMSALLSFPEAQMEGRTILMAADLRFDVPSGSRRFWDLFPRTDVLAVTLTLSLSQQVWTYSQRNHNCDDFREFTMRVINPANDRIFDALRGTTLANSATKVFTATSARRFYDPVRAAILDPDSDYWDPNFGNTGNVTVITARGLLRSVLRDPGLGPFLIILIVVGTLGVLALIFWLFRKKNNDKG